MKSLEFIFCQTYVWWMQIKYSLTHSLTSRPSSMRVGDSRRTLRYLSSPLCSILWYWEMFASELPMECWCMILWQHEAKHGWETVYRSALYWQCSVRNCVQPVHCWLKVHLSWGIILASSVVFTCFFMCQPRYEYLDRGLHSLSAFKLILNTTNLSSLVRRHGTSYRAPSGTLHPWTVSRRLWKHFCLHLISDCTLHIHCCMHHIFSVGLRFVRRHWIGHRVTTP